MYSMTMRQYDPAIARWVVIDPRVEDLESITPYNAFINDPVRYSDPEGDIPPQLIAGTVGALWEYGSQVYTNYKKGDTGFDAWVGNVDFADVVTEGVATGLTMGANKIAGDVVTEGIKASVDWTPNSGTKVVGRDKKVTEVLKETAQNTLISKVGGVIGDKTTKTLVNKTDQMVKKATTEKTVAYKQLQKSNNIAQNGNTRVKAENNVKPTERFKNVVQKDQNLTTAKSASSAANSTAGQTATNKAATTATESVVDKIKNWWNNL